MADNTEESSGTIKYGDLTFKTTKRYVKPIGPRNKIVESNNRKAPDSEWTECPLIDGDS